MLKIKVFVLLTVNFFVLNISVGIVVLTLVQKRLTESIS